MRYLLDAMPDKEGVWPIIPGSAYVAPAGLFSAPILVSLSGDNQHT